MWDSRALRLLTIFFCGPTTVTPTFFKSLVWRIGIERGRQREGEGGGVIYKVQSGEKRCDRGKDWEKKQSEEGCDTLVTFNGMLPALLPSLFCAAAIHNRLHFPEGHWAATSLNKLSGVPLVSITNKQRDGPVTLHWQLLLRPCQWRKQRH